MPVIETALDRSIFFDEESSFAIFRSPDGYSVKGHLTLHPINEVDSSSIALRSYFQ
jgi:hypothetical protein